MTKRSINIFVGYQIVSSFHKTSDMKTKMAKGIRNLVSKKSGLSLEFKFGDKFAPGDFLFHQVQAAIHQCEIAIFDISENNPNVMIEIGMALGAQKRIVVLKNRLSKQKFNVPSDISAFVYVEYRNIEDVIKVVAQVIMDYNSLHTPTNLYFEKLWGFKPGDAVYIICPELSEPEKRQNPEDNEFLYLGKYGDIDSLLVLYSSLSKLYPSIDLKYCTSNEFKALPGSPHAENLIILGGPDYNEVTKYYMEKTKLIPYRFTSTKDDEIGIKHPVSKEILIPTFDEEGKTCIYDHGFFVKVPNPANPSKRILMINGLHTYGVYGSAKCFSLHQDSETEVSKENCRKIVDLLGYNSSFAIHFQVDCINYKTMIPKIKLENVIKL